jgi:putrescine importer
MSASPARHGSSPTPHLRRTLTLWQLIIIGIVTVQPIAPMGIFGSIHNHAGGHVVTTILLAMLGMLFTAISDGRMARVYPIAGSAYVYAAREIHPAVGYVAGWAMVMDYVLNPLICTAICSKLSQNVLPGVPYWAWVLFYASLMTTLNLRGIKTTARINEGMAAVMVVVIVIFFVAVGQYVFGHGSHAANFFVQPFYNRDTFSTSTLFHGTSLAVLTYIGFEGLSTFSEEVQNPRRNVLLATVLVVLLTGVLSSLQVYAAQLVWGPKPFPSDMVESAFPLVARQVGGWTMFHLLNFTILFASVGSGMGAQLAASRLLYGMGRSDALPQSFFGAVEAQRRIPRNNVILTGVIAMAGAFILNFERGAELLNFGAFIAFMGINAAAFTHYFLRAAEKRLTYFLPPVLGFFICAFIWWNLGRTAKIAGTIWLVIGLAYGAWRTRAFKLELTNFQVVEDEPGA